MLTTTEIEKTGKAILKVIKDTLKERKELAKNHAFTDTNVPIRYDSIYDAEKKKYVEYIEVYGHYFKGMESMNDSQSISRYVISLLADLKKTRGWKNLTYNTKDIYEGVAYWERKHYILLDKVALPDNPCADFKSIQSFLKKYGNCDLPDFKLFSACMGGKRGRLFDEYGDRYYLANKKKKCATILNELRSARGTRDIVTCKFGREEYISDMERRYSEYHETECEGELREYVEVTIKTPSGKVKYQQKLY